MGGVADLLFEPVAVFHRLFDALPLREDFGVLVLGRSRRTGQFRHGGVGAVLVHFAVERGARVG